MNNKRDNLLFVEKKVKFADFMKPKIHPVELAES